MNELTCPNCKKAFKVDEAGFANLLKQVRDAEFSKELSYRLKIAEDEKLSALELAKTKLTHEYDKILADRDKEIDKLKSQSEIELQRKINEKDSEISKLKDEVNNKEKDIELAVSSAVRTIEKERDDFKHKLDLSENKKELHETNLRIEYDGKLKSKDEIIKFKEEEIERYKDFKQRLSTKMIGETLEQHCEIEFNKLRPYAFQSSYFEKDNDSKSGSKGDFIFREHDQFGNEVLSIMFEMKNEVDETATKKKNEDFLKELDKDRVEKNCEYAVLVSLLECDSEFYNCGIVDMSHKFPKMYVVRPQFFIPIITILRNAALNASQYKAELAQMRNQNIDVTNFENKITNFRDAFSKNYFSATKHFESAITEIDNAIKKMEKVKAELTTSQNQLRLANDKAQDLTIKKLTHDNPTMKAKFDAITDKLL